MTQLSMGSVRDPHSADSWARLQAAVIEATVLITPKELAYRLDIAPSYLTEAIHEKNNKGFRLSWLPEVIRMAPLDLVPPILRSIAELRGFTVEKRKKLTAEEKNVATREVLRRIAPGLLPLIDGEVGE